MARKSNNNFGKRRVTIGAGNGGSASTSHHDGGAADAAGPRFNVVFDGERVRESSVGGLSITAISRIGLGKRGCEDAPALQPTSTSAVDDLWLRIWYW